MPELPKQGERVLFCKHQDVSEDHISLKGDQQEWYVYEDCVIGNTDTGEDLRGTIWLCLCEECHLQCKSADEALAFAAQDVEWIGPAPNITRIQ